MQEKNRIVWIDWAKVILIYLMVVGHALPCKWENQVIYAFHMPAFFIISGFLYHEHRWYKTLKSLGIPVLVFSLVNFLIWLFHEIIIGRLDFFNLFERIFIPFWDGGNPEVDYIYLFPGFWFILALLLGRFLMGDISVFRFIRNHLKISIIVLLVYLAIEPFLWRNISNPFIEFKFYRIIPSLPFLLFGHWLKDRIYILDKITNMKLILMIITFIGIALLQGYCNILNYRFGLSYIVFFFNAILGSLILFSICSKLRNKTFIRVLSCGTLFVLAFNFILIQICKGIPLKLNMGWLSNDQIVYPWIIGLIVLMLSYYPIKILIKYCPIILGK